MVITEKRLPADLDDVNLILMSDIVRGRKTLNHLDILVNLSNSLQFNKIINQVNPSCVLGPQIDNNKQIYIIDKYSLIKHSLTQKNISLFTENQIYELILSGVLKKLNPTQEKPRRENSLIILMDESFKTHYSDQKINNNAIRFINLQNLNSEIISHEKSIVLAIIKPETKKISSFPQQKNLYIAQTSRAPTKNDLDHVSLKLKLNKGKDIYKYFDSFYQCTLHNNILFLDKAHQDEIEQLYLNIFALSCRFVFFDHDYILPCVINNQLGHQKISDRIIIIERLYELSEFGKKFNRYIIEDSSNYEANIKIIASYQSKIEEVKLIIRNSCSKDNCLSELADFLSCALETMPPGSIKELAQAQYDAFDDFSMVLCTMYDLLTNVSNKKSSHPLEKLAN